LAQQTTTSSTFSSTPLTAARVSNISFSRHTYRGALRPTSLSTMTCLL
jgi:hypothetical protein